MFAFCLNNCILLSTAQMIGEGSYHRQVPRGEGVGSLGVTGEAPHVVLEAKLWSSTRAVDGTPVCFLIPSPISNMRFL